jgi:hypothetical protein
LHKLGRCGHCLDEVGNWLARDTPLRCLSHAHTQLPGVEYLSIASKGVVTKWVGQFSYNGVDKRIEVSIQVMPGCLARDGFSLEPEGSGAVLPGREWVPWFGRFRCTCPERYGLGFGTGWGAAVSFDEFATRLVDVAAPRRENVANLFGNPGDLEVATLSPYEIAKLLEATRQFCTVHRTCLRSDPIEFEPVDRTPSCSAGGRTTFAQRHICDGGVVVELRVGDSVGAGFGRG